MKSIITLAILVVLTLTPAAQADEVNVTAGRFAETTGDKAYDYSMSYVIASTKVEGIPIRLQVNRYSFGATKVFANAGRLDLAKDRDIKASFSPGVVIVSDGRVYGGGNLNVELPKLDLSVTHRYYLGAHGREQLTFATWQPTKTVGLQAYGYGGLATSSHWYLGPTLNVGPLAGYAGKRVGGRGWAFDITASVKF